MIEVATEKKTKRASLFVTAGLLALSALASCGVRGRPQPPLTPAELGRGQPTFKRATEELAFPSVPSPDATPGPQRKRSTGRDAN